jgi:hypothetical protein
MWMGGTPPLGYKPDGRSLAVVADHAGLIRDIYRRYLDLGNVRLVVEQLDAVGIKAPRRTTAAGRDFGDCRFSRGQIYKILSNPIYIGEIVHQGKHHAGQHAAIIDRGTWDTVQSRLADHLKGERRAPRAASPSLLAGLIVDEAAEPLVAAHACKGTEVSIGISPMVMHAQTEEDFDKTDLIRAMSSMFDQKCWNGDKLTLYRWFTNSVKAKAVRDPAELRFDASAAAESRYRHTSKILFCGRHIRYSGLSGNSTDEISDGNESGGFALADLVVSF